MDKKGIFGIRPGMLMLLVFGYVFFFIFISPSMINTISSPSTNATDQLLGATDTLASLFPLILMAVVAVMVIGVLLTILGSSGLMGSSSRYEDSEEEEDDGERNTIKWSPELRSYAKEKRKEIDGEMITLDRLMRKVKEYKPTVSEKELNKSKFD